MNKITEKWNNFLDFLVLFVFPFGVISAIVIMGSIGVVLAIVDWILKGIL